MGAKKIVHTACCAACPSFLFSCFGQTFFWAVPHCDAKSYAVHPVLHRWQGSWGQQIQESVRTGHFANASPGTLKLLDEAREPGISSLVSRNAAILKTQQRCDFYSAPKNPKDPPVLKILRRINSLSVEISCAFFPRKQGVSETLPYYFTTVVFFPTTVVN